MMIKSISWLIVALATSVAAQTPDPRERHLQELERLSPDRPSDYLELAEDILDGRYDHSVRGLVIELCVLAHRLDIDNGGDTVVASGACAILATLPGNEAHSTWLRVMSRELDEPSARLIKRDAPLIEADHSLRYRLAVLIGQLRSGDGVGARSALSKPDIADSIKALSRLFVSLGIIADIEEFNRQAARWPCPDCGNDRIIRRSQGGGSLAWKICPSCGGVPGPRMFRAELLASLRVESVLLEGDQKSWSAQLSMDYGAPLVDPIPETVSRVFRVDTSRCVFRDGRWCKPE